MTIQFLTEQWAHAVTTAANNDEKFRAAAKGHELVLQVAVSDSPQSSEYYMHFDNGTLDVRIGLAPSTPDVRAELTYETNVALSKGELNGQTAAMTGRMKAEGDMLKMMSVAKAQDRLAQIESALDLAYQL